MISRFAVFLVLVAWSAGHAQPVRCDLRLQADDARYADFLGQLQIYQSTFPVRERTQLVIPVVVHVVSPPDALPVSLAQVLHQLDVLNADFAGEGEHAGQVPAAFRDLVADAGIRFCLATADPSGQPTSGITYTQTDIPDIALRTGQEGRHILFYDQLGGKSGWDPSRYLNIWVAEYGDFLGSASFPGMAPFPEETGIVIHIQNFGSIGEAGTTVFFDRGHTLAHEAGHYFGLKHIWGDGLSTSCADTDDIDDTPNAAGPYYGCPGGTQTSCGTDNMYMNFMDFTDDRCLALFTPGQVERMQLSLAAFYPSLGQSEACRPIVSDPEDWWSGLVWAYDQSSGKYIAYHPSWDTVEKTVEVFSIDGRLVHSERWGMESSHLLDISRGAAGVYIVRIMAGDRRYVRSVISY